MPAANAPTLPQQRVEVGPTRTTYEFGEGAIHVTLSFTTPALPEDLDVLARPATYVDWTIKAPGASDAG